MPFQVPNATEAHHAFRASRYAATEALFWTVRALRWKMILEGELEPKPDEKIPDDLLEEIAIKEAKDAGN